MDVADSIRHGVEGALEELAVAYSVDDSPFTIEIPKPGGMMLLHFRPLAGEEYDEFMQKAAAYWIQLRDGKLFPMHKDLHPRTAREACDAFMISRLSVAPTEIDDVMAFRYVRNRSLASYITDQIEIRSKTIQGMYRLEAIEESKKNWIEEMQKLFADAPNSGPAGHSEHTLSS